MEILDTNIWQPNKPINSLVNSKVFVYKPGSRAAGQPSPINIYFSLLYCVLKASDGAGGILLFFLFFFFISGGDKVGPRLSGVQTSCLTVISPHD